MCISSQCGSSLQVCLSYHCLGSHLSAFMCPRWTDPALNRIFRNEVAKSRWILVSDQIAVQNSTNSPCQARSGMVIYFVGQIERDVEHEDLGGRLLESMNFLPSYRMRRTSSPRGVRAEHGLPFRA